MADVDASKQMRSDKAISKRSTSPVHAPVGVGSPKYSNPPPQETYIYECGGYLFRQTKIRMGVFY